MTYERYQGTNAVLIIVGHDPMPVRVPSWLFLGTKPVDPDPEPQWRQVTYHDVMHQTEQTPNPKRPAGAGPRSRWGGVK